MDHETEFITDQQIYQRVLCHAISSAKHFLWLGTSDLKDLYIHKGKRMVPFLEILSDLVKKKVAIRLIHAKEPGEAFRHDFDRYPGLINGMERLLCPRIHFKTVVVDGTFAYSGSANLTGAGMGAKSPFKRNFEAGFITTNPAFITAIMNQFDELWMGKHCPTCKRKDYCPDYLDVMKNISATPRLKPPITIT